VAESDTALGNELVSVSLDEILIQSADTQAEWQDILTIPDAKPAEIDATGPTLQQIAWTTDSPDFTISNTVQETDDDFSNGEAESIDQSTSEISFDFTVGRTVEASDVGVWARFTTNIPGGAGTGPGIEVTLNGETWQPISDSAGFQNLDWRDLANDPAGTSETYEGGDLEPGTYTITFSSTGSGDGQSFDVIAPVNNAFVSDLTFDDTVNSAGGYLDGPEFFPNLVELSLDTAGTRRNVDTANFDSSWNDVSNGQYVELANDGSTFTRINNSETGSVNFAGASRDVDINIGIDRYSDGTQATPLNGRLAQQIDTWSLFANPDAVTNDDIGATIARAIVPPNTIDGETVREAGLQNGSTLLTRHELAEAQILTDQRLASAETTRFNGTN